MAASILTAKVTRTSASADSGADASAFSTNDTFVLRVFQGLITSGNPGAARFTIDDSLDGGSNWLPVAVFTVPLTLNGLPADGQAFSIHGTTVAGLDVGAATYEIRSNLQIITGTGATVTYQFERQAA